MKKLDKVLLAVGIYIAIFIQECILIFIFMGCEPTALITSALGSGILEAIVCAVIKIQADKKPAIPDDVPDDGNLELDLEDNDCVG